ncbi:MAG: STAS domain-containing protein [Sulfuricaulis sp.]
MIEGIHLTPIGDGNVLLEPGEGLDPGNPEALLAPVLEILQQNEARRLVYDLKSVRLIDAVYYSWLTKLSATCRVANVEMVTVNMQPAAAYALALALDKPPTFGCALDIHHLR